MNTSVKMKVVGFVERSAIPIATIITVVVAVAKFVWPIAKPYVIKYGKLLISKIGDLIRDKLGDQNKKRFDVMKDEIKEAA